MKTVEILPFAKLSEFRPVFFVNTTIDFEFKSNRKFPLLAIQDIHDLLRINIRLNLFSKALPPLSARIRIKYPTLDSINRFKLLKIKDI